MSTLDEIAARDRRNIVPDHVTVAEDRRYLLGLVREAREEITEWVETESGPGAIDLICPRCDGWHPKHKADCSLRDLLARLTEQS